MVPATRERETRLDGKIAKLEDRITDLEEDLEVLEKDKIRPLRRQAGHARVRGDREEAERLDGERTEAEAARESIEEGLKNARTRLRKLRGERDRHRAAARVGVLADRGRDVAAAEAEAREEGEELLRAGISKVQEARNLRVKIDQVFAEIQLLAKLFDADVPDELPDGPDRDELAKHCAVVGDAKSQLKAEVQRIGRGRDGGDSVRSATSSLTRTPSGRPDHYRKARAILSRLSDETRDVASDAIADRLWRLYESMDDEAKADTIPPKGGRHE